MILNKNAINSSYPFILFIGVAFTLLLFFNELTILSKSSIHICKITLLTISLYYILVNKNTTLFLVIFIYVFWCFLLHRADAFFFLLSGAYAYGAIALIFYADQNSKFDTSLIYLLAIIIFIVSVFGIFEHGLYVIQYRLVEPHFDPILFSIIVLSVLIYFCCSDKFIVIKILLLLILFLTGTRATSLAGLLFLGGNAVFKNRKDNLFLFIIQIVCCFFTFWRRGDFFYQQIYGRLAPTGLGNPLTELGNQTSNAVETLSSFVTLAKTMLGHGIGVSTNSIITLNCHFNLRLDSIIKSNSSSIFFELFWNFGVIGLLLLILVLYRAFISFNSKVILRVAQGSLNF
jgi:hypothetical protein